MILNPKGKIAQFYEWNYAVGYTNWQREWVSNLPTNICPLFWQLAIAGLLFPLTWLSFPFDTDGFFKRIGVSLGCWLMLVFTAVVCFGVISHPAEVGVAILAIFLGVAAGVLLFVIERFFIWGFPKSFFKIKEVINYFEFLNEITLIITERKKAFKDNWCPVIEWKEVDEEEDI